VLLGERAKPNFNRIPDGTSRMIPSVFLSYAHADIKSMASIKFMLDDLQRNDQIVAFHDGEIRAGQLFDAEIERHLHRATHILLGISDNYITSEYVGTKELPVIKNRMQTGSATVFPLIIKGANWRIFMEGDRARFLKRAQFWPVVKGYPVPMSGLSADEQIGQIIELRQQLVPRTKVDLKGNEAVNVDLSPWWGDDEDAVRAYLPKLRLPGSIDLETMNVQLPSYLAETLECGSVAALIGKANEVLYEIDKSEFSKRKIPEPPLNLSGQEEPYWADILFDLSRRSPLSIVTLLALAYRRAPGVKTVNRRGVPTPIGSTSR
jgi:hypothetical protein